MIDQVYKDYFSKLNSLEFKSNQIDEISNRLEELKKFINGMAKDGEASLPSNSNFFDLNINFKNFQNELDLMFEQVLKDKFFDKEEYEIITNKISDMFSISIELNCIRDNFHDVIFNSKFFINSFDEKSKKHFLKLLNKELNTIFSKKVMNVKADRVPVSMGQISKELNRFNNKILDVITSLQTLDKLLLDKNFNFKLLFQNGKFINYHLKRNGKDDFDYVLGLISSYSFNLMNSLILMSANYKKYNKAYSPINNFFSKLSNDDNFETDYILKKVEEIFKLVKSNSISELNALMEQERKNKLKSKITKYVLYTLGAILLLLGIFVLLVFLMHNFPIWTSIGLVLITIFIYKLFSDEIGGLAAFGWIVAFYSIMFLFGYILNIL